MSLNEANYCGVQQDEMIIKKEAAKNVEFDDSWPTSLKMKCENGQNDRSCDQSSELNNFEKTFSSFPVKQESKDSQDDDVHQMQPENLKLKEEKIDIQDHKPIRELIGSGSNFGMFKDELDRCDNVVGRNELQSSEGVGDWKKYNCAHCLYKTNSRSNFIVHYVRKHKQCPETYKCNECSYRIKSNMAKHYKHTHSKYVPIMYKCEECSFESRYKCYMTKHYENKHSKGAKVYNYKCQECPYKTIDKSNLARHYKCKHSKEVKMYKCEQGCSFETKYKSGLTRHYKHKHSEDAEVYKCRECSYKTKQKSHVARHYNSMHAKDATVYKCQECSFETIYKSYMTKHYEIKHSEGTEVYKRQECPSKKVIIMSLNAANFCDVQHQEMMIKKEAVKTVQFDDSWPISEVKCDNLQNDSIYDQSSELNNFEKTFSLFPVKHEPEDSQDDDVHQVQPENLELKEEEIDIEECKPELELIGSGSNFGMSKDELDRCDTVVGRNELQSSKGVGEWNKYNCAHCLYKTNCRNNFIVHYATKHKQCPETFKCNECSYESRIKSNVAKHYKYKHSNYVPIIYKCEECSFESRYKCYMTKHYENKHSKGAKVYNYKCQECPYKTIDKSNLARHYKCKHSKEVKMYKCEQGCSFETKYKSGLTRHYKHKHSEDAEVYKCRECSYKTKQKSHVARHYNSMHAKEATVYKCQECSFETIYKCYMTQHYEKQHSKEAVVYKCQECPYKTKHKSNLARHYKRKH